MSGNPNNITAENDLKNALLGTIYVIIVAYLIVHAECMIDRQTDGQTYDLPWHHRFVHSFAR